MNTDLETKVNAQKIIAAEPATMEYSVVIDGVVEIAASVDDKAFFDGLFEAIIEYVEKHNASAGLSISHKQYQEESDKTDNEAGHDREKA